MVVVVVVVVIAAATATACPSSGQIVTAIVVLTRLCRPWSCNVQAKRAASAAASAKRKLPSSCKHERGDDEQALVPHVPFGELCSANDAVDLAESKPAYVDHLFQVSFKGKQTAGKRRNHLTPRGQLVTAIRRIISQSAANSFGAAILTDMDGKSVNNCERVLGACSIASFMAFHQRMESELVDAKHRALERGIVTHAYSAGLSA